MKGFKRVHFEPGEVRRVTLDFYPRDLAYWDTARHAWVVESEPIRVLVGGSSDNLPLHRDVTMNSKGEYKP